MSQTFEIYCNDCQKTLWIGQGGGARENYIYRGENYVKALEDFLYAHRSHKLGFDESQDVDSDFEEIKVEND